MRLAIFDLDNTLIAGDSDHLWGQFLCEVGAVDPVAHAAGHDRYYQDYLDGTLDIHAFLRFQLAPLAAFDPAQLLTWRERFLKEKIDPIRLPQAETLIAWHRDAGHTLLIITATNRFITEPIARLMGIDNLIATEPERVGGRFTGEVAGIPSYAGGKVQRLELWLAEQGARPVESWFYSDSHNDLPLLSRVEHPVAVDPDRTLRQEAQRRGWPVLTLREPAAGKRTGA